MYCVVLSSLYESFFQFSVNHFYIVKMGVSGLKHFSYFALKHKLWVLIQVVQTSTNNLCLCKNMINTLIFHMKIVSLNSIAVI